MRHHEPVLAMRMAGYKPSVVTLNVDWNLPRELLAPTDVLIEPADIIRRLDLRFLIGCGVIVMGDSDARVAQAADAARLAGASYVLSGNDRDITIHFPGGRALRHG